MDSEEFRKRGKEMVDYVADYLENIRDRRPLSNVKPGYLRELLPEEAPRDPEPWNDVFRDVERVIMPGVSTLNSFVVTDQLLADCKINLPNCQPWKHY